MRDLGWSSLNFGVERKPGQLVWASGSSTHSCCWRKQIAVVSRLVLYSKRSCFFLLAQHAQRALRQRLEFVLSWIKRNGGDPANVLGQHVDEALRVRHAACDD